MMLPVPLALPVRSITAAVVQVKVDPDTLLLKLRLLVLPLHMLSLAGFTVGIGCTDTLMVLDMPVQVLAVAETI